MEVGVICALVATTSGATSRKKYAAAPAPTAVASRMVSRLTAEALAVCARVRRVAGIVFSICYFLWFSPPLGRF